MMVSSIGELFYTVRFVYLCARPCWSLDENRWGVCAVHLTYRYATKVRNIISDWKRRYIYPVLFYYVCLPLGDVNGNTKTPEKWRLFRYILNISRTDGVFHLNVHTKEYERELSIKPL